MGLILILAWMYSTSELDELFLILISIKGSKLKGTGTTLEQHNSKDSLDQTPDSIDLTESPVKHTNTQRHIEKINEDTSDDDTDETITFDNDKVKKTYRKDTNALRKRTKTVKLRRAELQKCIL